MVSTILPVVKIKTSPFILQMKKALLKGLQYTKYRTNECFDDYLPEEKSE
ncbi:MAG: hypothetical protein M3Z01_07760 [Thermoproteota archaeon]|nr:hypothetical protein [Thermoproteota archaeon]